MNRVMIDINRQVSSTRPICSEGIFRCSRSILLALLLAAVTLPAIGNAAATQDCPGAEGGTWHEACQLDMGLEEAGKKLDSTYAEALKRHDDPDSKEANAALTAAQEQWSIYRDRTCELEDIVNGGAHSISRLRCLRRMLDERIQYLQAI